MKLRVLFPLIIFVFAVFSGCIPTQKNSTFDFKGGKSNATPPLRPKISLISIVQNQLIIQGDDLDKVTQVKTIQKGGLTEVFTIESKGPNFIVANGLRAINYISGKLFELVITDAHGAAAFPITFDIQDGSVTGSKLASMGAGEGDILRYNSQSNIWEPANLNGLTFQGTWDSRTTGEGGAGSDPSLSPGQGDFWIVSMNGSINLDGNFNWKKGDWVIYNGTNWEQVQISSSFLSKLGDTVTGDLTLNTVLRLKEESLDGTDNYITLKAPTNITADFNLKLPPSAGANGQILSTDGAGNLSWVNDLQSGGDITSVNTLAGSGMTGGAGTGDPNIQILVDDTSIEIASNALQIKNDGVSTVKIGDNMVTLDKLQDITQGSIIVGGASDAPTILDVKGNAKLIIGDGTSITSQTISGAINLSDTGIVDINNDVIFDRDINLAARIDARKLGTGVVDNTEFNYLNGQNQNVATGSSPTFASETIAGDLSVDTNTLFVDSAANKVGVGTLSPSVALEVNGNIIADTPTAGTHVATKSYVDGAAFAELRDADNDTLIQIEQTADEDTIHFDTKGTEKMVLTTVGNLGIGNTSPTGIIDTSLSRTGTGTIAGAATTIEGASTTDFVNELSPGDMIEFSGAKRRVVTVVDSDTITIDSAFPSDPAVSGFSIWKKVVFGARNVGIGVANPTVALEVGGPIIAQSTQAADPGTYVATKDYVDTIGPGTNIKNNTLGATTLVETNSIAENIILTTNSVERFRIDSSGNLGVGTNAPAVKLHTHEASAGATEIKLSNTDTGVTATDGSAVILAADESLQLWNYENKYVSIGTNNAERLRVLAGGNVGIGTIAPATLLEVSSPSDTGDSVVTIEADADNDTENDNPYIHFKQDAASIEGFVGLIGNAGAGPDETATTGALADALYIGKKDSTSVQIGTNNIARITVAGGGNVGIGETIPLKPLSIGASSLGSKISLWDNTDANNIFGFGVSSGQLNYHVDQAASDHVFYATGDNGDGTELVRIEGGGNVGIGVTPTAKLDVNGAVKVAGKITNVTDPTGLQDAATKNYVDVQVGAVPRDQIIEGNSDVEVIDSGADGRFVVTTEGSERMRVDNVGNVGIGTIAPAVKLHTHEASAGAAEIKLSNTDTGVTATDGSAVILAADESLQLWNYENNYIAVGTNNAERMRIDASGNVGIGTTSPGYPLHIYDSNPNGTNGSLVIRDSGHVGDDILSHALISGEGSDGVRTWWLGDTSTGTKDISLNNSLIGGNVSVSSSGAGGEVRLSTNGSDRVTVDDSGNVGIGTTSPDTKLHVAGSIKMVDGNQAAGRLMVSDANGVASWSTTGTPVYSRSYSISFNVGGGGLTSVPDGIRIYAKQSRNCNNNSATVIFYILEGNLYIEKTLRTGVDITTWSGDGTTTLTATGSSCNSMTYTITLSGSNLTYSNTDAGFNSSFSMRGIY